jgi:hypothetical protein
VLGTEGLDEFDIFSLSTGLDENAKMGLAFVKSLGAFTKTTGKTIVDERIFQDLLKWLLISGFTWLQSCTHLKSLFDGELSLGSLSGNLDFSGGFNRNVISSFRHPAWNSACSDCVEDSNTHFLSDFGIYYCSDVFVRLR